MVSSVCRILLGWPVEREKARARESWFLRNAVQRERAAGRGGARTSFVFVDEALHLEHLLGDLEGYLVQTAVKVLYDVDEEPVWRVKM